MYTDLEISPYICFIIKSNIMTTYKQINFKRDYETTNIKFIQVLDNEVLDPKYWVVCDESEIDCGQLWKEGNKIKFGYL